MAGRQAQYRGHAITSIRQRHVHGRGVALVGDGRPSTTL